MIRTDEQLFGNNRIKAIMHAYDTESNGALYDNKIKTAIRDYLPTVPIISDLETKITELPMQLRPYLKLQLYRNEKATICPLRLYLMYWLLTIVTDIYNKHELKNGTTSLDSASKAADYFFVMQLENINYKISGVRLCVEGPDFQQLGFSTVYYEVQAALRQILPVQPENVEVYCNWIVRKALYAFAADCYTIEKWKVLRYDDYAICNRNHHNTAEQEFYMCCLFDLKMPLLTSFILENNFSYPEIIDIHKKYNLF